MAILFHDDESIHSGLKKIRKTKSWIKSITDIEGYKIGNINVIFTSDEELLRINIDYLDHDFYTDIISFDYSENRLLSGDIYISIDRVKDNAKSIDVEQGEELLRVIIHGILHLMGYKDSTDTEKRKMREMENMSLDLFYSLD